MPARILIAEDEEPLSLLLRYNLEAEGFAVEVAARGDEAELRLREEAPDLLLLDWMLPGLSGIELCRRLRGRKETEALPVIMLTARGEESDRVRGLAIGADDYVVKPFSVPELMARVKALLRRSHPERLADQLIYGDLRLDRGTRRVWRGEGELHLGPTEFRLLEFLMERPGRVYSRAQLLDAVWGRDAEIDERTVDVHVGRLRKAITPGQGARSDQDGARRGLRARRDLRQVLKGAALRTPPFLRPRSGPLGAPCVVAVAATVVGGLVGDAAVIGAIGLAGFALGAAEAEIGVGRIAHRPAAHVLAQLHDGDALGEGHHHFGSISSARLSGSKAVWTRAWTAKAEAARLGDGAKPTTGAGRAAGLRGRAAAGAEEVLARPDRPSRWTLPITALRVTPPSSPAIWLALRPSFHSFFRSSTRSSVHPAASDILLPPFLPPLA